MINTRVWDKFSKRVVLMLVVPAFGSGDLSAVGHLHRRRSRGGRSHPHSRALTARSNGMRQCMSLLLVLRDMVRRGR